MSETTKPNLIKAAEIRAAEAKFSHPWNPQSCVIGSRLGLTTGLQRTGVNITRIPPGKESFVYHRHYAEEEWVYIISGRGVAEIDGKEYEVGAGDFMGFPTPSVAHHLRNPFAEDLVYLMGGENRDLEVADFPKLGKRMFRRENQIEIYDLVDTKGFGPLSG
jgi:uncharacterized cupin superfamily protein